MSKVKHKIGQTSYLQTKWVNIALDLNTIIIEVEIAWQHYSLIT